MSKSLKVKNVIDSESAKIQYERMCDFWEKNPDEIDANGAIINAIKKGRIVFDEKKGHIQYSLKFLFEKKNGEILEKINLKSLQAESMMNVKSDGSTRSGVLLICESSKIDISIISKLELFDTFVLCLLTGFFP